MRVPSFYSVNQAKKPADKHVYHNNDKCPSGYDIPKKERRPGTIGRLCERCNDLNAKGI